MRATRDPKRKHDHVLGWSQHVSWVLRKINYCTTVLMLVLFQLVWK